MKQYRILEIDGIFFPQEKKFWWWEYLDKDYIEDTWIDRARYYSACVSKEAAETIIEKRIKYNNPPKDIIHKYNK